MDGNRCHNRSYFQEGIVAGEVHENVFWGPSNVLYIGGGNIPATTQLLPLVLLLFCKHSICRKLMVCALLCVYFNKKFPLKKASKTIWNIADEYLCAKTFFLVSKIMVHSKFRVSVTSEKQWEAGMWSGRNVGHQ